MKYAVKNLNLDAGKPIVFLNREDAGRLRVHPGDKAVLSLGSKKEIATVDITSTFVRQGQLGISREISQYLGATKNALLGFEPLTQSESSQLLKQKHKCEPYTSDQLKNIMGDVVKGALSEAEIAYFISGVNYCGMSLEETHYLINAIVKTGNRISWGSKKVADKHSIGGIPGNRTTPIVVAICAAAGVIMPKTSSRAITSAAGTADTIETLAPVNFTIPELKEIVRKTGACLAWGGALGLAPADDRLIQVEKALNLDPEPQLLASILSKKVAIGSKYVLIDIPYGSGAKVSRAKALALKKKFLLLGKRLNLTMDVVLTEGSQPIGNGIGPSLEMRDVLNVLSRVHAPKDLEKKSIMLAGRILELTGASKRGKGAHDARTLLEEGKAFVKFKGIIKAQGGKVMLPPLAPYKLVFRTKTGGRVTGIRNKEINMMARIAGCPQDKRAGIDLHVHVGSELKKGEYLFTLYAESRFKLNAARIFAQKNHPVELE